ncbi:LxmA leader domain family RiPP [Nakamurella flavida]|uniref:LxmA leader domain family RiPP n=1 Tax=Nakamurella flavida TaxID=363630 RepID=A0A939C360_9ACTN|nr:LxmA leader domain family RiPP [Nakamurella flavida]MBM9476746.1 LxmA leader domain family RiPP [Nakamurella flavida]MDP9778816.1 hypothetical protein [Nakamurella flavida]
MQKTDTIIDLVEGYSAYTDVAELNVDATSPAPAASTSPVCVASLISSWKCAAASGAGVATITTGC